jgi:tRNA(adenine34) deaminase
MKMALAEARQCGDDVPIGCLIVKDGEILARTQNQRERTNDPCGHAEILALREAAARLGTWRMEGCTLYCTLEPCPMCAEAILQARTSRLVFGAFDLMYGAVGSAFDLYTRNRTFPLPEVLGGVLEEPCRQLVRQFFKQRRQT